jgi:hypothetical protein
VAIEANKTKQTKKQKYDQTKHIHSILEHICLCGLRTSSTASLIYSPCSLCVETHHICFHPHDSRTRHPQARPAEEHQRLKKQKKWHSDKVSDVQQSGSVIREQNDPNELNHSCKQHKMNLKIFIQTCQPGEKQGDCVKFFAWNQLP